MADGVIKFEIETKVKNAQKEFAKTIKSIDEQKSKVDELEKKYKELDATMMKKKFNTSDRDVALKSIQKQESALESLKSQLASVKDSYHKMYTENQRSALRGIALASKEKEKYYGTDYAKSYATGKLKSAGLKLSDLEQYGKMGKEADILQQAIDKLNLEITNSKKVYNGATEEHKQVITQIGVEKEALDNLTRSYIKQKTELGALYKAKQGAENQNQKGEKDGPQKKKQKEQKDGPQKQEQKESVMGRVGKSIGKMSSASLKFASKSTWKILSGSVRGLISPFKDLYKHVSKFGSKLKYAIMQGLLLRPLRNALGKVSEAFMSALKQNEQFSASIANMKGTIYTGLAPAFNALVPIISNFINWIAKALTYLFTFINMLFKLGGASKKAGKEFGNAVESSDGGKGSNFASWDTVQQLSSPSGDSGATPPTYEQDFSEAEGDLARIKEKILDDDWYGVGMEISKGLNEILTTIDTWFVSTYIPKMHELGKNMGDLFNGLFDGLSPSKLGKTVADACNGIIELFASFFETADLSKMAEKLATNINSLFKNFDFERLASGLSSFFSGIFNGIASFFQKIDGALLYERIKAFFTNIEWGEIAKSIFSALGSALGASIGLIFTVISDLWKSVKEYFKKYIDSQDTGEAGMDIIRGIFQGILDAVKNIGTWIKEHIFQPFIDGFKKAFKIHSPSKVMEEQGGFIVDGLLSGIKAIPEKVKAVFESMKTKIQEKINTVKTWMSEKADAIKDKFVGAFTKIKTKVTDVMTALKNAIKKPINGIIGFINKLISGIVNGINNMIRALNKLHFTVPSWIPVIGGKDFGFNLKTVSAPQIPYLAQGTVVNPSHEFLAMLGDNRQEQEIVSPLSTMKQALLEALHESGMSGNKEVVLQLDGKTLARATVPYYNNYSRQIGISAIR